MEYQNPELPLKNEEIIILYTEVPEELLGYPEDSIASTSQLSQLSYQDDDLQIFKGIFIFHHRREILFKKRIKTKLSKLPKWKPQITLSRSIMENDEE